MKTLIIKNTVYAENTEIGKGAIVALDRASPPIINLLKRTYRQNPSSLTGDIHYLLSL